MARARGCGVTPVKRASAAQTAAANPRTSAWVSANAGSGKTRVLTNRVARLLLHGVAPRRILCLTYTKAAAAEMSKRLFETLGRWSTMEDQALIEALAELEQAVVDPSQLAGARRLFAEALETPGGLQIETIHAFCQRVLKRFPVEARLPPDFEIMDDSRAAELRQEAIRSVVSAESGPIFEAVSSLLAERTEQAAESIAASALNKRAELMAFLLESGGEPIIALSRALDLDIEETEETVRTTQLDDPYRETEVLLAIAAVMTGEGSKTDIEKGAALKAFLRGDNRSVHFADYRSVFLTSEGTIRKRLTTKAVTKVQPNAVDVLTREGERLRELDEKLKACLTRTRTLRALTIGEAAIEHYTGAKKAARVLDYDDLIAAAEDLITADQNAWVKFKLDGGIDHILVDEAQDTSPPQWRIVAALGAEFFEEQLLGGAPSRTLFAVGDEKQSIYSFQGADPTKFNEMRDAFGSAAAAAQHPWLSVELDVSFRSASQVLQIVDDSFAEAHLRRSLSVSEAPIAHVPQKTSLAGIVELWPPFVAPEKPKQEPWQLPVDRLPMEAPERALAARIAERIKTWLDAGEWLTRFERPMTPGDIMVLVRDRDRLFFEIVSALKASGLDVAGMDRIVLRDELAFLDLEAIGRFASMPGDDLALAEVLKGPLFAFSDDDLMAVAVGRKGRLWPALCASELPYCVAAADRLGEIVRRAKLERPYEFLRAVLEAGGRRALWAHLGDEAGEVIEELLSLALSYEREEPPTVQGFLGWLSSAAGTVKRDMEQAGNKIRVMTVHGAKGLEAPVVVLPQTHIKRKNNRGADFTQHEDSGVWLWPAAKVDCDQVTLSAIENVEARQEDESRRQLYVAMTRAEERLYVCGLTTRTDDPETSWHGLVRRALEGIGKEVEVWPGTMGLRFGEPMPPVGKPQSEKRGQSPELPQWLSSVPPTERKVIRRSPSGLLPEEEGRLKAPSPLLASSARARGIAVHKLLEILPVAPHDQWPGLADAMLARHLPAATGTDREQLYLQVKGLLEDPAFSDVFSQNARAEVPLTGIRTLPDGASLTISGQIDRLCVTADTVLCVDFKSNAYSPARWEDAPRTYLAQMAAYRLLLQDIFQGKQIVCGLLWVAGPRLMLLPDEALDVIEITEIAARTA